MNDESRYQLLNPAALAAGFAAAALAIYLIFGLPIQLSMAGALGTRMPMGMGYSAGAWMFLGSVAWVIVVSAIGGAILAFVYNAMVRRAQSGSGAVRSH